MDSLSNAFEATIDFRGQVLAERVTQVGIVVAAVLAFGVGQVFQSFECLLLTFGGGVVLTLLLVLPPWPMYNRHPVQWLKSSSSSSTVRDTKVAAVSSEEYPEGDDEAEE
ncbi:hypothetical protein IWQ60_000928 [Tieghemiomyces parasiticus]|uniref:Signal peptidase complex subunit 1 n=1 Tax=Tieghemiomyces parasiticus TaxID=78921 RepID=A0A9W8AHK8_9FUNG|nr:hypothetical protein IWQ60_000928 [Tieghemiomyces parasiticus]